MRKLVIGAIVASAVTSSAVAAWHVEEANGDLLLIGAGEAKGGGSGFVTIRCEGKTLSITGTTPYSIARSNELDDYLGAKVLLGFGGIGEREEIEMPAVASESVGRAVLMTIQADEAQSAAIMKSIRSGNRLDFAVKHLNVDPESANLRVYSGGFTTVIFATDKLCPGFKE